MTWDKKFSQNRRKVLSLNRRIYEVFYGAVWGLWLRELFITIQLEIISHSHKQHRWWTCKSLKHHLYRQKLSIRKFTKKKYELIQLLTIIYNKCQFHNNPNYNAPSLLQRRINRNELQNKFKPFCTFIVFAVVSTEAFPDISKRRLGHFIWNVDCGWVVP